MGKPEKMMETCGSCQWCPKFGMMMFYKWDFLVSWSQMHHRFIRNTVDGLNSCTSLSHYLQGFTSQVVQDFFHQQYHCFFFKLSSLAAGFASADDADVYLE